MRPIIFVFLILGLAACKQEKASLPELDLLQYGAPLTIKAPEGAEVKKASLAGVMDDITIRKDDYDVQLLVMDAYNENISAVLQEKKLEVKMNSSFSKMIKEEDDGFIYELKLDENTMSYDFFYTRIQGSKQYDFQAGYLGSRTLEQVEHMYESVQQD